MIPTATKFSDFACGVMFCPGVDRLLTLQLRTVRVIPFSGVEASCQNERFCYMHKWVSE